MVQVAKSATITLHDVGMSGVHADSPLEDITRAVWLAASRLLVVHSKHTHHGGLRGSSGELIMKNVVRSLFPSMSHDELDALASNVNKVLRSTGAAVCLISHSRTGSGSNSANPVWFIANEMPESLPAVARAVGNGVRSGSGVARPLQLTDRERRLTPHEAGEDRPPEPVVTEKVVKPVTATTKRAATKLPDGMFSKEELGKLMMQALAEYDEPLAAVEIAYLFPTSSERASIARAGATLRHLYRKRLINARHETWKERQARSGLDMPAGRMAVLYWPKKRRDTPRVTRELVAGFKLDTTVSDVDRLHTPEAQAKAQASQATRAATVKKPKPAPPKKATPDMVAVQQALTEIPGVELVSPGSAEAKLLLIKQALGTDDSRCQELEAENRELRNEIAVLKGKLAQITSALQ